MSVQFQDDNHRLARVVDALDEHPVVTLYGLPGAGKTALACAAIAGFEGTTKTLERVPPADEPPDCDLVLIDGADGLSRAEIDRLALFASTLPTRWLITRRRRLGIGLEAGVLVGTLTPDDADQLLARFLDRRGCSLSVADRRRLVAAVSPLPGVLFEASRLAELLGPVGVADRWEELDPLPALVAAEIGDLDATAAAAMSAAACFVTAFDAVAFEAVGRLGPHALAELVDRAFVEPAGQTDPPKFVMLPALRAIAPPAPDEARQRHARWVAESGSREDLLHLAEQGATGNLPPQADAAFVEAVVRLCEGPLPPTTVVDAALAVAEREQLDAVALLRCGRSRIALRDGDPTTAAELAEAAASAATTDAARVAVLSLRAQIARVIAAPADALREYEEALTHDDVPENVLLEYAATLWESGDHAIARQATERALDRARQAGDARREGVVRSNLGVMAHHAGELTQARRLHEEALVLHTEAGNRRFEGIAHFDLATLDHEIGAVRRALAGYDLSVSILDEAGDRRLAQLSRAAAEAARAQLGEAAVWPTEAIEARFRAIGDAMLTEAVALYRRVIDALTEPDVVGVFDASPYAGRPDELQLPARLLAAITASRASGQMLWATGARDRFWLGDEMVDLGGRDALRNTFALLTDACLLGLEHVTLDAIIAHGWPDEVVTEDAAKNRAHVALSTLRRLGLRDVIQTVDGGYRLATLVAIRQTSAGPTTPSS